MLVQINNGVKHRMFSPLYDWDFCTIMDLIEIEKRKQLSLILYIIMKILHIFTTLCIATRKHYQKQTLIERPPNRIFLWVENLNQLIYGSDIARMEQLRMDSHTFTTLCFMLCTIGKLNDSRYVDVKEIVTLFLHIAHGEEAETALRRAMQRGDTPKSWNPRFQTKTLAQIRPKNKSKPSIRPKTNPKYPLEAGMWRGNKL